MPRRRPTNLFAELCEGSPQPIYVVDDQRQIAACNPACAEWLGLARDQLVGQRCDYSAAESAAPVGAAAAALCPPPQAFLGEPSTGWVTWPDQNGQAQRRCGYFLPLHDEESPSVLVVLGGIESPDDSGGDGEELLDSAELHQRLQQLARGLRARYRLDQLVGTSPAIRRVREQVAAAIASRARVLVVGPPGSGREHVARTIHGGEQPAAERPLLPLLCPLVDPDALHASLESFRQGLLPGTQSRNATLLLIDVDQLSPAAQAELAEQLRSSPFARVLATAHRPLLELSAAGSFDAELAYDLSTLVIELPALGDRLQDIPLLAQRMVEEHNARGGRQLAGFAPAALDRLASLPWTGNVEELAAVVREACQTVSTVWIGEADLPPRVRAVAAAGLHPRREPENIQLDAFLLEIERELLQRSLRVARGNKSRAARLLGISRARLLRRLEQLGLLVRQAPVIDFRPEPEEEDDDETSDQQPAIGSD